MIRSMKDLSEALTAIGILISTSQEYNFLKIVKNFSISPPPQEVLEVSFDFPYKSSKDMNESCTIINGKNTHELEIKEFLTCLSADPEYNQETTHPKDKNWRDMEEEDVQHGPNQEMNQDHHVYMEHWFRTMTKAGQHSPLLKLLLSYHLHLLAFHAHAHFQVYMLNLSMNIYFHLIRTWLHWKYSYT